MKRQQLTTFLLALSMAAPVVAADGEKPSRRPKDTHGFMEVTLSVPFSKLNLRSGEDVSSDGTLWFQRLPGKKFEGATTLSPQKETGGDASLPPFELLVDADLDAAGEEENLNPNALADSITHRLVSSSDLGLIPLRALVPHLMVYDGKSRTASKKISLPGASLQMTEKDIGLGKVGMLMMERYFTHTIRKFTPSGYELHDFVYTCEYEKDQKVMFGCGIRLLVQPALAGKDGVPPSGIIHMALFETGQVEWRRDPNRIDDGDRNVRIRDRVPVWKWFRNELTNALLESLSTQGIGDPFDSSSVYVLNQQELVDERTLKRIMNSKNRKALVVSAPLLVDAGIDFDPGQHLALWKKSDDPAERLLLAAAARAGGADEKAFATEANLAIESDDPSVLRAAVYLAKALGNRALELKAQSKLDASR